MLMLDNKKSKAGMFHTHASDTRNKHILGATQKHDVANKHITSDVGSALLNASVFTCIHEYTTASSITHPDKYIEIWRKLATRGLEAIYDHCWGVCKRANMRA